MTCGKGRHPKEQRRKDWESGLRQEFDLAQVHLSLIEEEHCE